MTIQLNVFLAKGQPTNQPPLFNDSNYTYWKACIHIFIQALTYDLWSVIINGPHTPTITIDGKVVPKSKKDQDDIDKKMTQLNTKAMNVLYCSLDINEFN